MPKFAVLGCGNSGQALAADIALKGFKVNLGILPELKSRIEPIRKKGGIELSGEAGDGFAQLDVITTNMEELIKGADIIFIAAPAYRHELFVKALAPYFADGQYVVFVSNFGALRFKVWAKQVNMKKEVIPVETQSLIYTARIIGPAKVRIFDVKKRLPAAALPARFTGSFMEKISRVFPEVVSAPDVLFTSLNNMGAVFHPALLLMNAGRIEATKGKGWNLYSEGATESVAQVILGIDRERLSICDVLGITGISIADMLVKAKKEQKVTAAALSQAMRNHPILTNPAIPGPASLNNRFIIEDVPYSLAAWSALAHMWSVSVPTIDAVISMASRAMEKDCFAEGTTTESLGIEGYTPEQTKQFVE